jgi:hypothetical protein
VKGKILHRNLSDIAAFRYANLSAQATPWLAGDESSTVLHCHPATTEQQTFPASKFCRCHLRETL